MTHRLNPIAELSPNIQALPLVQEMMARGEQLKIGVSIRNKAKIIDCGVNVPGGFKAGILFSSVCLGGMAQVKLHWNDFMGWTWPSIEVMTDHPVRACLASQYAGWPVKMKDFWAMASGPGRAIVHKGPLFSDSDYEDDSGIAIICLESEMLPEEEIINTISELCKCDLDNLYILVAPTSSQVGSIQIAARALETGLAKLMKLGYELENIESGWGICPIPPVAVDKLKALGRTNDAILYGSKVLYNLRDEDENLVKIVKEVPATASLEYGHSFAELFEQSKSFYDIDPLLFSPAEVWLCNLNSGNTFHSGITRPDILRFSFGID